MSMFQRIKDLKAKYIEEHKIDPTILALGINQNFMLTIELQKAYDSNAKVSECSLLNTNVLGMTVVPVLKDNFFACSISMKELDNYDEAKSEDTTT